jgi:hypothetical protein
MAQTSRVETLLNKIDFEKAYDHMDLPFLLTMLQALGLGPRLIHC